MEHTIIVFKTNFSVCYIDICLPPEIPSSDLNKSGLNKTHV